MSEESKKVAQGKLEKVHQKVLIMREMFKSMVEHDRYELVDGIGFFIGMHELCEEMNSDLGEVRDFLF